MNDLEQLAYRLWCEAREMEEKGNKEVLHPLPQRSSYWYGQATGLERAAWMVLTSSGQSVDAEFFKKADAARLERMVG